MIRSVIPYIPMCINKSVNKSIIHTSITTDCYTLEISTVIPHIYVYRYIYQSDLMKCKSPFRTQLALAQWVFNTPSILNFQHQITTGFFPNKGCLNFCFGQPHLKFLDFQVYLILLMPKGQFMDIAKDKLTKAFILWRWRHIIIKTETQWVAPF